MQSGIGPQMRRRRAGSRFHRTLALGLHLVEEHGRGPKRESGQLRDGADVTSHMPSWMKPAAFRMLAAETWKYAESSQPLEVLPFSIVHATTCTDIHDVERGRSRRQPRWAGGIRRRHHLGDSRRVLGPARLSGRTVLCLLFQGSEL